MGVKETITAFVAQQFIEKPAGKKSVADLASELALGSQTIDERAAKAGDAEKANVVLRHIIGIERWGQRRLRVFLGDKPTNDEYDGYQPGADLTPEQMRECFRTTRSETVKLAERLARSKVAPDATVQHNSFGPISLRAWLGYLHAHANRESKRMR
jgi:hypothetical protein